MFSLFSRPDPKREIVKFPRNDVDDHLESYVTRLLAEAGIPSFIWGEPYLRILGSRTWTMFSGYVVPDVQIENAAAVLNAAKFPPCHQGKDRCTVFWKLSTHPYPDFHWHIDHIYPDLPTPQSNGGIDVSYGVQLFRKSRLFWTWPDPPLGEPAPDNPYYMLTTDARINTFRIEMSTPTTKLPLYIRGRGRQDPGKGLWPVKMPVPARYFEAIMLLSLRDVRADRIEVHWEVEISYLLDEEHVWGFNLCLEDINEPFREYAKRYAERQYGKVVGDERGDRYFYELYLEMKRRDEIPPRERPLCRSETFRDLLDRMGVQYRESDLAFA